MNNRIIHSWFSSVNSKQYGEAELAELVALQGIQGSIVVLSKAGLLLFSSWQMYLSSQPNDILSDVPHLKSRLEFYLKKKWTINESWKDFQKIIGYHADEIMHQAGRNGFNIPNFSIHLMTYEIFRKLLIETSQSAEIGIGEAIRLANFVPDQVDILLKNETLDPAEIQVDPEEEIVTQSAELMPLSDDHQHAIWDKIEMFQAEMATNFEKMGLVPIGEKPLETVLQSALEEYISLNFAAGNEVDIELFKNKIHGGQNIEGHIHYRLSLAVSDQIGENLKSLLTSLRDRRKLSQFINMKLFEDQIQIPGFDFYDLELDFQIWTPKFGKEKPWYSTRNGIGLKVVQGFK